MLHPNKLKQLHLSTVVVVAVAVAQVAVHKNSFLKDLVFYIAALVLMMVILYDQKVRGEGRGRRREGGVS
jgi:hypothetical protein